jgi:predicted PurR-regulated permease PerM
MSDDQDSPNPVEQSSSAVRATREDTEPATLAAPPAQGTRVIAIQARTIWLVVGIAVSLWIAWVVMRSARDALLLLFIGIVLAEGLRPLIERLGRRGVPRPLAVLVLYAVGQNPQAAGLLTALSAQIGSLAQQIPLLLITASVTLVDALFKWIEILLIAFLWLTATRGLTPFVVGLLPVRAQMPTRSLLAELSHGLGGYLRGVTINMLVIGLLSGAGVAVLGVPYPLLLGLLSGLTETLPLIGPWISGSAAILVALLTHGAVKGGEVAALYVAIQTIEGNTLVPYVMARTTALNPLTVLVAVLIGGAMLGLVGAVVAVPVAVVLEVMVLRVLAPAARRVSASYHMRHGAP